MSAHQKKLDFFSFFLFLKFFQELFFVLISCNVGPERWFETHEFTHIISLWVFEEVVVGFVKEFPRLGRAFKWKIYYFIGFSAQASRLIVFLFWNNRFIRDTICESMVHLNMSYPYRTWMSLHMDWNSKDITIDFVRVPTLITL